MLSKQYLEREYKQAIREFKGAISEEEKWQALSDVPVRCMVTNTWMSYMHL